MAWHAFMEIFFSLSDFGCMPLKSCAHHWLSNWFYLLAPTILHRSHYSTICPLLRMLSSADPVPEGCPYTLSSTIHKELPLYQGACVAHLFANCQFSSSMSPSARNFE